MSVYATGITVPNECLNCSYLLRYVLSAFSALRLLVGRQEGHPACKKTEWWGAGVVICLERGAADATVTRCLLLQ